MVPSDSPEPHQKGPPDEGGPQPHQHDQAFAAALSAKLDSLTELDREGRAGSSPEDRVDGMEVWEEYENPDSMETQGDALCIGSGPPSPVGSISELDLANSPNSLPIPDCDPESAFTSSNLAPVYGPLPDPSSDPIFDSDSMMIGPLFEDNTDSGQESGDIVTKDGVPGVCGLRNLGNTCFMNSGLQCILASPTIVEYFLHFNPDNKLTNKENEESKENTHSTNMGLSRQFTSLLQQIYSGKYSVIQPGPFKDTLSDEHTQFKGYRQHDSQEFLALLLDTLHEQLVSWGAGTRGGAGYSMSECTSMELHTPHSTEISCNNDNASNVFNFNVTGKMFDKESDREADQQFESVSEVCRADLESVNNIDGTESRGSASPKSYTSYSSSEDKVLTNIRMAPIPETMKQSGEWMEQSDSRTSTVSTNSEQEDTTSDDITTNLVTNEQLIKKKSVAFSDTVNSIGSLG